MASFKAKFPVLQELFAKNHRGALWPPQRGEGYHISAVPGLVRYNALAPAIIAWCLPGVVENYP